MRYNSGHIHNKARKELAAHIGNWLRRGSGGDARHVSTWIVACIIDGIERDMAGVTPDEAGNPHTEPHPSDAPRPIKNSDNLTCRIKQDNHRKKSDTSRSQHEDLEGYVKERYDEGVGELVVGFNLFGRGVFFRLGKRFLCRELKTNTSKELALSYDTGRIYWGRMCALQSKNCRYTISLLGAKLCSQRMPHISNPIILIRQGT